MLSTRAFKGNSLLLQDVPWPAATDPNTQNFLASVRAHNSKPTPAPRPQQPTSSDFYSESYSNLMRIVLQLELFSISSLPHTSFSSTTADLWQPLCSSSSHTRNLARMDGSIKFEVSVSFLAWLLPLLRQRCVVTLQRHHQHRRAKQLLQWRSQKVSSLDHLAWISECVAR